jgi:hypothetical protein
MRRRDIAGALSIFVVENLAQCRHFAVACSSVAAQKKTANQRDKCSRTDWQFQRHCLDDCDAEHLSQSSTNINGCNG